MRVTILFLFLSCKIFGQTADTIRYEKNPINFVLSPGISYQKKFLGELNFYFAEVRKSSCGGRGIWGPRLGVETNFDQNNFIIAPKIGYEFEINLTAVCLRGNAVCYFNNTQTDLRFLPEIGITLDCMINITVGYGLSMLDYKIPDVSPFRVALTLNLVRDWWGF